MTNDTYDAHKAGKERPVCRIALLIILLIMSTNVFAQGLSSIVDRTQISEDESITLKVIFDAFKTQGQPDFSDLNSNFDIVSNNVSRQQSYVNGDVTASTEWRLVLFPKKTGQLLIPPFSYEGYTSKPITVTVTKAQNQSNAQIKPDVFLETFVDKTDLYVQEQTVVTFKLHYSRNVSSLDNGDISQPDLKIEELPRADYQKTIGQKTYGVAEFRYALIADASGTITIPSQTWTIETTDGARNHFFNGGRRKLHRVKTDAITLNIKPKPSEYPAGAPWLPASNLEISQSWSQAPDRFKIGEPITRTVNLEAVGVSAEQLPVIFPEQAPEGFKYYPDKPTLENQKTNAGLLGARSESVAIVPVRSGALTLPEIQVSWWDTESDSLKYASLPAVTVQVAAAPQNSTTAVNTSPAILPTTNPVKTVTVEKTSPLWQIIAAGSLLLNAILVVVLVYLANKRQPSAGVNEPETKPDLARALKSVVKACNQNDPSALRQNLITWGALQWPGQRVSGLDDISRLASDENLNKQLHKLNAQMFSPHQQSVDFQQIRSAVEALPSHDEKQRSTQTLKPLYGA